MEKQYPTFAVAFTGEPVPVRVVFLPDDELGLLDNFPRWTTAPLSIDAQTILSVLTHCTQLQVLAFNTDCFNTKDSFGTGPPLPLQKLRSLILPPTFRAKFACHLLRYCLESTSLSVTQT